MPAEVHISQWFDERSSGAAAQWRARKEQPEVEYPSLAHEKVNWRNKISCPFVESPKSVIACRVEALLTNPVRAGLASAVALLIRFAQRLAATHTTCRNAAQPKLRVSDLLSHQGKEPRSPRAPSLHRQPCGMGTAGSHAEGHRQQAVPPTPGRTAGGGNGSPRPPGHSAVSRIERRGLSALAVQADGKRCIKADSTAPAFPFRGRTSIRRSTDGVAPSSTRSGRTRLCPCPAKP